MGTEITRAVAQAGYRVIMACYNRERAAEKCRMLKEETGNPDIEVRPIDLADLRTVAAFAEWLTLEGTPIALLMNNAGTMEPALRYTADGLERTASVNYVGPYLLTRLLLPLMQKGTRVVQMVSCTYAIGKLNFDYFFDQGCKRGYWRIPVYSNTKLALTLFTIRLAELVKERGIVVNCADPGIVSTDIVTMHMWFDPITDLIYRPLIRTPRQGADTAIRLLLDADTGLHTGMMYKNGHPRRLSEKYTRHPQLQELWDRTEKVVKLWL